MREREGKRKGVEGGRVSGTVRVVIKGGRERKLRGVGAGRQKEAVKGGGRDRGLEGGKKEVLTEQEKAGQCMEEGGGKELKRRERKGIREEEEGGKEKDSG